MYFLYSKYESINKARGSYLISSVQIILFVNDLDLD